MRAKSIPAVFLFYAAATLGCQAQTRSVWDGAFTDGQAQRGAASYQQYCVMCHGAALEGNGEAPPLTGRFIPDWAGTSLADIFEKIQTTMPLSAPGTLGANDTADLLAFILKSNGFPSGSKELATTGESLKMISFDATRPNATLNSMHHHRK